MSTILVGYTSQSSVYEPYRSGGCVPVIDPVKPCQGNDWPVSAACNSQQNCSRLNPATCPSISGASQIGASWSPTTTPASCQQGPDGSYWTCQGVTCSYNLNDVLNQGVNGIQSWINNFGENDSFNQSLMPAFCSAQVTTCPIDPNTGNPMPSCSRLVSTGQDGTLCTNWASKNVNAANNIMVNYCRANNTPDCGCINRADNSLYKTLSQGYSIQDACWWKPCQNPTQYLVPSSYDNPNCPSTICTSIIGAANANNINISDNTTYISCSGNTPNPPPTPPTPTNQKRIIELFGLILLLVLFGLIYLAFRKR